MSEDLSVPARPVEVEGAFLEARRTLRLARDGMGEVEDSIVRGLRALRDVEFGRGGSSRPLDREMVTDGLQELARYAGKGVEAGLAVQEYLAQARWSVGVAQLAIRALPEEKGQEQSRVDGTALGVRAQRLVAGMDRATLLLDEANSSLRRTGAVARSYLQRSEPVSSREVENLAQSLTGAFQYRTEVGTVIGQAGRDVSHAAGHSGAISAASRARREERRPSGPVLGGAPGVTP